MSKKSKKLVKEPKPDSEETIALHVLYSQWSEGGVPESDEPYSNRSDEHTTTTFEGVLVGNAPTHLGGHRYQTFQVPKAAFSTPRKHVYAVVGYYQDGDTFGTSYGNMHIVEVCGNAERAHALVAALEAENRAELQERNPPIFGGSKHYVPWGGYFSRLERLEVEVLHVSFVSEDPSDNVKEPAKDDKPIPNPDDFPVW